MDQNGTFRGLRSPTQRGQFRLPTGSFAASFGRVQIRRRVPDARDFPCGVVQGGPKIVDSICYYKGDFARQVFSEVDSEGLVALRIGLNMESVWLAGEKFIGLPLVFRDMMVGPINFLPSSGEHG